MDREFMGIVFVEREPMWDGNGSCLNASFASVFVEREPMWDGNM